MVEQFIPLPYAGLAPAQAVERVRFNSLGSLFYFSKICLKRRRLTYGLHLPICLSLERDCIKDVYELPRDHFKSTICTESLPMWWSLPFEASDEDAFKKLGYSDEFVLWMSRAHRPEIRNLLISENITNAAKLGSRIRFHFESNDIYRAAFPETLPDPSCTWSTYSLHVKIPPGRMTGHGEGTFDFLGVGGALQSRHYDNAIQDDLVGRKALESMSIMEKTIEYHGLLPGAFESPDKHWENNELVVGNRWSYHDLNSHIREHEDWFRFSTHSALGGCCPAHPADVPIFPEEWNIEKLMRRKKGMGTYNFSCQYLNNPAAPDNADFKPEWLGYYKIDEDNNGKFLVHDAKDGAVRGNVRLCNLRLAMAVDPAHSINAGQGRCRHAIVVMALSADGIYYLIDCWAESCSYENFINKIYSIASKWGLTRFGLETVAAQKFLAGWMQYINRLENRNLKIIELKGEVELESGEVSKRKEWRIRNVLLPIFETERFYTQHKFQDFFGEYTTFPKGRYVDQIDALAYVPQMLTLPQRAEFYLRTKLANQRGLREVNAPYCAPIN